MADANGDFSLTIVGAWKAANLTAIAIDTEGNASAFGNTVTAPVVATPTPTGLATVTPTVTPTPTATATVDPAVTASPTATPTVTGTLPSETATPTPTATQDPAVTATPTPTGTPVIGVGDSNRIYLPVVRK